MSPIGAASRKQVQSCRLPQTTKSRDNRPAFFGKETLDAHRLANRETVCGRLQLSAARFSMKIDAHPPGGGLTIVFRYPSIAGASTPTTSQTISSLISS